MTTKDGLFPPEFTQRFADNLREALEVFSMSADRATQAAREFRQAWEDAQKSRAADSVKPPK